jgi:hypothetical protein
MTAFAHSRGAMEVIPAGSATRAFYASVVQGSAVCTQRPNPRLGSDDADIVRASQRQHVVEDMDRYADFSHRRSSIPERSPSPIICFHRPIAASTLARLVVAGGLLPGSAAALGDAPEMAVAWCRRDRSHIAPDRGVRTCL